MPGNYSPLTRHSTAKAATLSMSTPTAVDICAECWTIGARCAPFRSAAAAADEACAASSSVVIVVVDPVDAFRTDDSGVMG